MGERANVRFLTNRETGPIYLYGHWAGPSMPSRVQEALKAAQPRWDDPTYGCRIMVSQIIGKDWSQEYNWGLSTLRVMDQYPLLEVDFVHQKVRVYTLQSLREPEPAHPLKEWSFAEFIGLTFDGWNNLG